MYRRALALVAPLALIHLPAFVKSEIGRDDKMHPMASTRLLSFERNRCLS